MKKIFTIPLYILGTFLFIAYIYLFIDASFSYIQIEFGSGWAWAAIIAAFVFRFSLPLVIFSFCGAYYLWDWNIFLALGLAAPGLLVMIPAVIAILFESISKWRL